MLKISFKSVGVGSVVKNIHNLLLSSSVGNSLFKVMHVLIALCRPLLGREMQQIVQFVLTEFCKCVALVLVHFSTNPSFCFGFFVVCKIKMETKTQLL